MAISPKFFILASLFALPIISDASPEISDDSTGAVSFSASYLPACIAMSNQIFANPKLNGLMIDPETANKAVCECTYRSIGNNSRTSFLNGPVTNEGNAKLADSIDSNYIKSKFIVYVLQCVAKSLDQDGDQ